MIKKINWLNSSKGITPFGPYWIAPTPHGFTVTFNTFQVARRVATLALATELAEEDYKTRHDLCLEIPAIA